MLPLNTRRQRTCRTLNSVFEELLILYNKWEKVRFYFSRNSLYDSNVARTNTIKLCYTSFLLVCTSSTKKNLPLLERLCEGVLCIHLKISHKHFVRHNML